MANLVDIGDVPALDVWGDTVQARVVAGANTSLALVELAPGAIVPEHRHEHEQLGMRLEGSITFTVGGERRDLGPGGTWRIPSNLPHDAVAGPGGAIVVDIFSPVSAPIGMPSPARHPADLAGRTRADQAGARQPPHAGGTPGAWRNAVSGNCSLVASGGGVIGRRRRSARPCRRASSRTWRRTGSSVSFVTYARPS